MNQAVIHPQTALGRVRLNIVDLEKSIAFYREVVGLTLLKRSEGAAVLGVPPGVPLVELEEGATGSLPKRAYAGLYHFAILLPDRVRLGEALRRLIEHDIPFGQADHLVSEALYIHDPDGNGIEIYADRPRDQWTWNERGEVAMSTDPLDLEGLLRASVGRKGQQMPEGTTMGHVHLHVSDLGASRSFYHGILGFGVTARYGPQALFVSAGGYHHHLGLNTWAGAGAPLPPENAPGLRFFTVVPPDAQAYGDVLRRLEEAGCRVERHAEEAFALDPSGIRIRFRLPEAEAVV
ncbi:catechol-2,3-dioxygenase [Paenibacillus cisolokensis]|uniref:Catechol-2,3-dioxygenase n=1 Tax=Paenibacillus cisolokensis TaxID=1658519 RepID=A0ABQ4ND59_9BACL|nr:VOC family protein [Paenibacillus cisolokensis]GIQ66158.1 catechol-2,3-dioxygenase [Paenibacillus cisolokensis]